MTEKPKKIRFSKRKIQGLDAYPSSGAAADNQAVLEECPDHCLTTDKKLPPRKSHKKSSRFFKRCGMGLMGLCFLLLIVLAIVFVLLLSGINSEMLRDETQKRIQEILGPQAGVSINTAKVSLDKNHNLALEARDVVLQNSNQNISVEKLGVVKLGLAPLPLLQGNMQVAQVEVKNAVIRFSQTETRTEPLLHLPFDERGLIDFDRLSQLVFRGVDQTLMLLDIRSTQAIALQDVQLIFPALNADQEVLIRNAEVRQEGRQVTLTAEFVWQGQSSVLTAEMIRSENPEHATAFSLTLDKVPLQLGSAKLVQEHIADKQPNPAYFYISGVASLELSGQAATQTYPETLSARLFLNDAVADLGRERGLKGNIAIDFEHLAGADKLEIKNLEFNLGGLRSVLEGALGVEPEEKAGKQGRLIAAELQNTVTQQQNAIVADAQIDDIAAKPAYRFELVSKSAISAPVNSDEAPLPFGVKIAGRLMQDASRVDFNNLNIKTDAGELYGQGRMIFGHGSPAMIFLLRIPTMPVAQAKQLWPLNVANGARDWVLKNLFGGHMVDSQIDIALPAGHFNGPGLPPDLTEANIKADFKVENTRFDVIGDIPAVRDATGTIAVRGAHTTIRLENGTAFTPENRQVKIEDGVLYIPWGRQRPVIADLDLDLSGAAPAIAELVGYKPINALNKLPFKPEDLTGNVTAQVKVAFSVTKNAPKDSLQWQADLTFDDVSLATPFDGQMVSDAKGKLSINEDLAKINATAKLNNVPARLALVEPLADKAIKRQLNIQLELDAKARAGFSPILNEIFDGPLVLELGDEQGGIRKVHADLTKTAVSLPWIGWKKGAGIPARLALDLKAAKDGKGPVTVSNLVFSGTGFDVSGGLTIAGGQLQRADFPKINLTRNDNLRLQVQQSGKGYKIDLRGSAFDARALIQQAVSFSTDEKSTKQSAKSTVPHIMVNAHIAEVKGFYDESLKEVTVSFERAGEKNTGVSVNAQTPSGAKVSATSSNQNGASSVSLTSSDAGAVLRFFDFYDKMQGGKIRVNLTSQGDGPLYGSIAASDFSIINESKLDKLVSSKSNGGKSLNQAVRKNIDVSRVDFDRGYAQIEKGKGYLTIKNGVIRGPLIGLTFQGLLYDSKGDMSITGTFMPAYGLNRLFGELPLLGTILGNGRDRGLIGITYKLAGNAKHPNIIVNPISVIAPGIFRSIFEF